MRVDKINRINGYEWFANGRSVNSTAHTVLKLKKKVVILGDILKK